MTKKSNFSGAFSVQALGLCLLTGCALVVLAAFYGEVRASTLLLLGILLLCTLASFWTLTRMLLLYGTAFLFALLAACVLTPMLKYPLQALEISETPAKADAIVVLGASLHCGSATLTAASSARLIRGLELWQAGFAPLLTLSEPSGAFDGASCPKLNVVSKQQIDELYGSAGPQVLELSKVTTTRDEANRVHALAQRLGWKKILLITSPSHTRRAKALFERPGLSVLSIMADEPRYDPALRLPADRLAASRVVLYEWLSRLKALGSGR